MEGGYFQEREMEGASVICSNELSWQWEQMFVVLLLILQYIPEAFYILLKSESEIQAIFRERREGARKISEGQGMRQRGEMRER